MLSRSPILVLALLAPAQVFAQSWSSGPPVPTPGAVARAAGVAVHSPAGLFLLGGTPLDGNGDAPVHRLDGGATWSAVTPLEGGFLHHGAAVDGLGRMIVFAGEDAGGGLGDSFHWTVADGNAGGIRERSEQAPAQRFAVARDALGRVYSIGGSADGQPQRAAANGRVERYDASSDVWTVLASLPTPVADAAACADGHGRILVFGGFDATGNRSANVAVYDVASGGWSDTALPDLPAARSGAAAVRGAGGMVFVIGGSDGTPQATTWMLDPVTGSWQAGPPLQVAREHFGCVLDGAGAILAVGGDSTNTTELLQTPICPSIVSEPADLDGWRGASAGLQVEVDGFAPFQFQWRRDGLALSDGPTGGSSTVTGAQSAQLSIRSLAAADAGSYDCVVSNGCGTTSSRAALLRVREPAALPSRFVARSLHVVSMSGSVAYGVDAGIVVGDVGYDHPQYGSQSRPTLWPADGGAAQDLTPANSVGGHAGSVRGGVVGGWWWWPFTTPRGTGYNRNASLWEVAGGVHHQAQVSGWEYGAIADTDGQVHVGGLRRDDTAIDGHGARWTSLGRSARTLTPTGARGSAANAVDAGAAYGSVHLGFGVVHAAGWRAGSSVFLDLNPPGASASVVNAAGDGLLLGTATLAGSRETGVWCGTGASFQTLTPAGTTGCSAYNAEGGLIVGVVNRTGVSGAAVWRGGAQDWLDLHQYLPSRFTSSVARDVDVDAASGEVTIVGSAYDAVAGHNEAVVWRDLRAAATAVSIGAPCPVSVRFAPDGSGGYAVRRVAPRWVDDSVGGVELAAGGLLAEDALTGPQQLGFSFPMPGGQAVGAVVVDDNGRVLANGGAASDPTASVADLLAGPASIAPLWTDLSSARGSLRFRAGNPAEPAVVTWIDVPQRGTDQRLSAQLLLHPDGAFEMTWQATRSWIADSGAGERDVLVGCSPGAGAADPGAVDFSVSLLPGNGGATIYEHWSAAAGQGPDLQLHLTAPVPAVVGGVAQLELDGITSGTSAAWMLLGLADPAVDLTPIGLWGCALHSSAEFLPLSASIQGSRATAGFPVPADPGLLGVAELFVQGLCVAPGETALGVVPADALRLTAGR